MFYFLIAVICAALVLAVAVWRLRASKRRLETSLARYRETYSWLSGADIGHGSYRYLSIDGGKHWFSVVNEDGGTVIAGPADTEHIRQIQGWQRLARHVEKHGPIDPSDPSGLALLGDAGFKVIRRQD